MKLANRRTQRIASSFDEFSNLKCQQGLEYHCRLILLWNNYKVWVANSGYHLKHLAQKEFVAFLKSEMGYKIVTKRGTRWVEGICFLLGRNKIIDIDKSVGEILFERYGKAKNETLQRLLNTPYDFRRVNQTDDFSDVLINTGNIEADIATAISQIQFLRERKRLNF